jgi:hypothetical protein
LNRHILCPTFGYIAQTVQKNQTAFYASNVGIAKYSKKTNVNFVPLMQVFHSELYVFEALLMQ